MSRPHREVPKCCCRTLVTSHRRMQMVNPAQKARRPVRLRAATGFLIRSDGEVCSGARCNHAGVAEGGGGCHRSISTLPEVQPRLVSGQEHHEAQEDDEQPSGAREEVFVDQARSVLRWSRRTELHDGSVPSSQHGIGAVCSSILCCGLLTPRLQNDRKVGILDVGTVLKPCSDPHFSSRPYARPGTAPRQRPIQRYTDDHSLAACGAELC